MLTHKTHKTTNTDDEAFEHNVGGMSHRGVQGAHSIMGQRYAVL